MYYQIRHTSMTLLNFKFHYHNLHIQKTWMDVSKRIKHFDALNQSESNLVTINTFSHWSDQTHIVANAHTNLKEKKIFNQANNNSCGRDMLTQAVAQIGVRSGSHFLSYQIGYINSFIYVYIVLPYYIIHNHKRKYEHCNFWK